MADLLFGPSADEWNECHPVGTRVRAYPGTREDRCVVGRTRSEAWALGGHTPVVLIEGLAGCIALTHVDVVDEEVRANG